MADRRIDAVAVIGLGRFGIAVARELTRMGRDFIAIDEKPQIVRELADEFANIVEADATNPAVLRRLGVHELSAAVVAIGTDLEASVLTVLALAELEVPVIWAKAINERHRRILQRTGAHHVVMPEADRGRRVAHLVSSRMMDFIELDDGYAFAKTSPPECVVGRPLAETRVRDRFGITVVGVKPPGEQFTYATGETVVRHGDMLIVSGPTEKVERFTQLD
ncbi:potassium channel family protein [Thermaurantiacus sp.]